MVAVRNGLRGQAVTGAGPATLLGWLNVAAWPLHRTHRRHGRVRTLRSLPGHRARAL